MSPEVGAADAVTEAISVMRRVVEEEAEAAAAVVVRGLLAALVKSRSKK